MICVKTLSYNTKGLTDVIDITHDVEKHLEKNKSGIVNVFVKGSTASIAVIEGDPNLYEDMRESLEIFAPYKKDWKHHQTWEGDDNGASHLRATIYGPSETIPFQDGKLVLGTWQRVVLIDFDTRPRTREVVVSII